MLSPSLLNRTVYFPSFLSEGGEMSQYILAHDWSRSTLGEMSGWPQSLQTTLSIMLHSRLPMFLCWGPDRIIFYNDAYLPLLQTGDKHPWALGRKGPVVFPASWQEMESLIDHAIIAGGYSTLENQRIPVIRHGHEEIIHWTCNYSPVTIEDGYRGGVLVSFFETPGQPQPDGKLNNDRSMHSSLSQGQAGRQHDEAQLRYIDLADAMPQVVWVAEADGKVSYYNKRVKEFEGVRQLPDGQWEWEGLLHPADLQMTLDAWKKAIEQKEEYEVEHRLRMADGTYRWHLSRAIPQKNEQGEVVKWFGTATGIHTQKLLAEQIKESEGRFRLLSTSIPQIVWTSAPDGRMDYLSEQWEYYTGQRTQEALGNWKEVIHPDDLDNLFAQTITSLQTGEQLRAEYRLKNIHTGEYRWFIGIVQPLKDADGTVTKWIGSATDIQYLKDISVLLEQQVQDRTTVLKQLNLALQQSNEDLQQFAHVASHDLKEPLRKIRIYTGRLDNEYKKTLPEKAQKYIDKVQGSIDRMFSMVEGILDYSKLNTAGQFIEKIDLNRVMADIENDLEIMIEEKQARLEYKGLPVIEGITILIYQLFYNLIHNSLKFSKKDESLFIHLSHRQFTKDNMVYAEIIIHDNGIGFDQQQAEKIFNTFVQLNPKENYEGTGLGLALCKKIVRRHHGSITAKGESNMGAEVLITLPLQYAG